MTTKDAIKAALYTALWTFIGLFAASLLGWLNDMAQWAQDADGFVLFPDPSVLAKAALAAIGAALSGFVGFVVRYAQTKGLVPGSAPRYADSQPIHASNHATFALKASTDQFQAAMGAAAAQVEAFGRDVAQTIDADKVAEAVAAAMPRSSAATRQRVTEAVMGVVH